MQIMANIIGATHIFVYQVRKFNGFSISQKGKGEALILLTRVKHSLFGLGLSAV